MSNKKSKCMECGVKMTKQDMPELYSLCRKCKRIVDQYKDFDVKVDINQKGKVKSNMAFSQYVGLKMKGGK